MKGSMSLAALALASSLALPAFAGDQAGETTSAFCTEHGDLGLSHGGCVAYFETHNVVPHDASICQEAWIQSFLGVANHGQCVKRLAQMRR